jgi:hypothetical protein
MFKANLPPRYRQRIFTTRPQTESWLGSKRESRLQLMADQRAVQCLHPTTCASLGLTLHVGHRQSVPRLHWCATTQAGMTMRRVVKVLKVVQGNFKSLRIGEDNVFERRLAVQKQAFDDTVLPRTPRQTIAPLDAQSAKNIHPQIAAKHPLVVRPDDARHAVLGHGQQHVPQDCQRAFAWQQLQTQKTTRAAVNDSQHGKCEAAGRDPKGQVQRPRVTHGSQYRFAPAHSSAFLCDLLRVLGDEVMHPHVADRHVPAMHGVEGLGDVAAGFAKHGVVHHSFTHPFWLAPRADNARLFFSLRAALFSPPIVPSWCHDVQVPQQPPAQTSQGPQWQKQHEQSHQQIHPLQFERRLDRMHLLRARR